MATLLPQPRLQFIHEGQPIAGGKVYSYEAGTATPKLTYADSTGQVANTNPVILDAAGSAAIWIDGEYKIVVTDENDVQIFVTDNIRDFTMTGDGITATSTTSLSIAAASKTFVIQARKNFQAGDFVLATSDGNPAVNYMHGVVTDYTDDELTVSVASTGGSGTHADWTIRLSGPRGATGATGATGGGTGDMLAANNLDDVADAATARTNLGLGTAAVADTGTSSGQIPVLGSGGKLPAVDGSLLTGVLSLHSHIQFSVSAGSVTINKQNNIATITRTSQGIYTIVFTNALPATPLILAFAVGSSQLLTASGWSYDAGSKTLVVGFFQYNSGTANDPTFATVIVLNQ